MSSTSTPSAAPEAENPAADVQLCPTGKVDIRGRFIFADEHIEALLGLSQEELFGRSLKEFLDDSQHHILDRLLVRHSRFETVFESAELLFYDSEGRAIPRTLVVSLNFVAGNPVNFQIVFLEPKHAPTADSSAGSPGIVAHNQDTGASSMLELLSSAGIACAHHNSHGYVLGMNRSLHSLVPDSESIESIEQLLNLLVSAGDSPSASASITETLEKSGFQDQGVGRFVELRSGGVGFLWPLRVGDDRSDDRFIAIFTNPAWNTGWGTETIAAAVTASVVERLQRISKCLGNLGHNEFANLKAKSQRKLSSALVSLRLAEEDVSALARQSQLLCGPVQHETVDLNLTAGELFVRLQALYPELKLSMSYDGLARVRTSARHLDWVLETMVSNLIDMSSAGNITLSLETDDAEKNVRLLLRADAAVGAADVRATLLQPRAARGYQLTVTNESMLEITEGCLECMGPVTVDISIDESQTVIEMLLPGPALSPEKASTAPA